MNLSDLSDDNMRGYCHFPRKIYDGNSYGFTLEPNINYETNLGFSYKQLADETSLNWFYPELIEIQKKQAQKEKEQEERLKKTYEDMQKKLNPLQGHIDKQKKLSELMNPQWKKNIGIISDPFKDLIKPTQSILDQAKIASDWAKQNKGLIDQKTDLFKEMLGNKTEIDKMHDKLKGVDSTWKQLDEAMNPAWRKQLDENRVILARINTPEYMQAFKKAERFNKYLTPEYLRTTRNALDAFNSGLNHREILSRVKHYTSITDQVLNIGVSTQIARDMLEPHRGVTENLHLRLRDYEQQEDETEKTTEQLKEIIEQQDEQLDLKNQEIAELKAVLAVSKKQDKRIEKQTRKYQNHELIWRIDQALTEILNGEKPKSIQVWNELENNHFEYDEEAIIQSITNGVIEWRSKYGNEGKFTITSFPKILSVVRKKYSNNSN